MADEPSDIDQVWWDLYQTMAWIIDRKNSLGALASKLEDEIVAFLSADQEQERQAKSELIDALRNKQVFCHAMHDGESDFETIPSIEWSRLDLFYSPPKACGPPPAVGKIWRNPQFVSREIKRYWPASGGRSKLRKRGRPQGSGRHNDTPLLEEMHSLATSGAVKSILEAAKRVADRAEGGGTLASKIDRLRKAYVERY